MNFDGPYFDVLRKQRKDSYNENGVADALRKGISISNAEIQPLPGSKDEVLTIDSTFVLSQKESAIFIDTLAEESVIKSGEIGEYQYVHIASHGFVNQEEPEFSGIFLRLDPADTLEDGILFSGEVYDLNLNAELVTLSACETGLGKISEGEGIIGLTRALIYAGTKNVNVSLWKVSDASTRNLMVGLYDQLARTEVPTDKFQTLNYSRYLRQSKLQMIEDGEYAHPYYWSPFVLIGK